MIDMKISSTAEIGQCMACVPKTTPLSFFSGIFNFGHKAKRIHAISFRQYNSGPLVVIRLCENCFESLREQLYVR